jgi:hypothetical protein
VFSSHRRQKKARDGNGTSHQADGGQMGQAERPPGMQVLGKVETNKHFCPLLTFLPHPNPSHMVRAWGGI